MKYINTLLLVLLLSVILSLVAISVEATVVTYKGVKVNSTFFQQPYVPRVYLMDTLVRGNCGWCFVSGVVYISMDKSCDFEKVMKHEYRHAYYFRGMTRYEQVKYCRGLNMSYGRDCWEYYAEVR